MDKKTRNKFIMYIGLTAIAIPVIINVLMFITIFPVSGDSGIWINSLSTIWGSIVGGVIAGVLTLIGVKISVVASFKGIELTIKHQETERFKETIGMKLNQLYRVKKIVYKVDHLLSNRKYGWNEHYEKQDEQEINKAILLFLLPELNPLLESAAAVDWEFYDEIRKYVDSARECLLRKDEDFDKLTNITDELCETIEIVHEKRLSEKFKDASEN